MRSRIPYSILRLAVALLVIAGGVHAADEPASRGPTGRVLSEQQLSELEASLRATEIAFAASVAEKDRESFAGFIADEAIFVSGAVLRGKQAILEGWAVFFREDAPKLTWRPEVVEIQDDGELGMTRGPFTVEQPGPDGSLISRSGLFTSVWEHQADGGWKVIFDAGCPPCQAAE